VAEISAHWRLAAYVGGGKRQSREGVFLGDGIKVAASAA